VVDHRGQALRACLRMQHGAAQALVGIDLPRRADLRGDSRTGFLA
jgi:hypothetical protein